jgi:hypothetical protein
MTTSSRNDIPYQKEHDLGSHHAAPVMDCNPRFQYESEEYVSGTEQEFESFWNFSYMCKNSIVT